MRKIVCLVGVFLVAVSGCSSSDSSDGKVTRHVFMDAEHY